MRQADVFFTKGVLSLVNLFCLDTSIIDSTQISVGILEVPFGVGLWGKITFPV